MAGLAGKVALVTGAGVRVGRAIAVALGQHQMRVVVHFHQHANAAKLTCREVEQGGGEAIAMEANLMDRETARRLVDDCVKRWGQLDLLVSSAANFERIEFDGLDDGAWDRSLELNAAAPFVLAHRAAPALRASRGSIVFVTCASTLVPMRNYLPYVVSKAAVLQLMRVLALELAPDVRVNAVAPGTVLPPDPMELGQLERLRGAIPLGRLGHPEDVAQAVAYLAGADFVTGQQLVVDGGRSVAARETFG